MRPLYCKRNVVIIICLIATASLIIIATFGVPAKRTYLGTDIEKKHEINEIKDIAITTEEREAGENEMEIIAKQEWEKFPKEMERIEKEQEAIEDEMAKEMERIEKEQEAIEDEMAKEMERIEAEMVKKHQEQEEEFLKEMEKRIEKSVEIEEEHLTESHRGGAL